jgi:hypothetical protein
MEEAVEAATEEARDEEEFQRIAEAAEAAEAAAPAPMEMDAGAGAGGKVSYHGLVRVLVAQCQRPHRDYRRAAVAALTDLALAFPNADALALAEGALRRLMGEQGEEEDGGMDHVLRARAVEALGALFPPVIVAASSPSSVHATQQEVLPWLLPALLSRASYTVWSLRQAVFRALKRVAERIYVPSDEKEDGGLSGLPTLLTGGMVDSVVTACLQGGLGDLKFHQVRAAAIDVLLALVKRREAEARLVLAPQQERILAALDKCLGDSQPAVVLLATEARAHYQARA